SQSLGNNHPSRLLITARQWSIKLNKQRTSFGGQKKLCMREEKGRVKEFVITATSCFIHCYLSLTYNKLLWKNLDR
ncbi:hypothetical protein L9F63_007700, partial [Diploptera punctata]